MVAALTIGLLLPRSETRPRLRAGNSCKSSSAIMLPRIVWTPGKGDDVIEYRGKLFRRFAIVLLSHGIKKYHPITSILLLSPYLGPRNEKMERGKIFSSTISLRGSGSCRVIAQSARNKGDSQQDGCQNT